MVDRFVPAWYDYGVRKGPILGIGFHMAEGGGTVGYLDNKGTPPRLGVSVHAVIEYDGSLVQMLPYSHACGGLHPGDIGSEKPYYKGSIFKAVMGNWWSDPNSASIQCEIEGLAATGPNLKQVATLIKWANSLKTEFPSIIGAFGHADQTDEKPCPGTTAAMKSVFDNIGGHGVFSMANLPVTDETPALIDVNAGNHLYEQDGKTPWRGGATLSTAFVDRPSPFACDKMRAIYLNSGNDRFVALCFPNAVKPVPASDTKHTVTLNVDGVTAATVTV